MSSGFPSKPDSTSPISYRDYLENWNFTRSKFTYDTFRKANNKGADQTARIPPKAGFLATRPL